MQRYLEAECWGEQPGGVKGRRGGVAPALGQLDDSVDVGLTLWSGTGGGLELQSPCPYPLSGFPSSHPLPNLWEWAFLFFLSFFPSFLPPFLPSSLPPSLPPFLSSFLPFLWWLLWLVSLKILKCAFIWFSREAFNNILLGWCNAE